METVVKLRDSLRHSTSVSHVVVSMSFPRLVHIPLPSEQVRVREVSPLDPQVTEHFVQADQFENSSLSQETATCFVFFFLALGQKWNKKSYLDNSCLCCMPSVPCQIPHNCHWQECKFWTFAVSHHCHKCGYIQAICPIGSKLMQKTSKVIGN